MRPGQRLWNEELVRSLFAADVALKILSTPLLPSANDTILWNPGPKGCYTVKSAYHLCHSVSSQFTPNAGDFAWCVEEIMKQHGMLLCRSRGVYSVGSCITCGVPYHKVCMLA